MVALPLSLLLWLIQDEGHVRVARPVAAADAIRARRSAVKVNDRDRGGQRHRQAGKANFHFRASASPRGSPNPIRQSGAGYFCAKLGIFKPQSVQPILSGSLVCPAATATVLAALREGVLGYLGLSLPWI